MVHKTIPKLFFAQAQKYGPRVFLRAKRNGRYQDFSWTAIQDDVLSCAAALRDHGIKRNENVAILSESRPEWATADLAILSIGAITVPIYATSTPAEIQYILEHSQVRCIFISTPEQAKKFAEVRKQLPSVSLVVTTDVQSKTEGVVSFAEFIGAGRVSAARENIWQELDSVVPTDLASIIYTSGTTGPPKGVMLTHINFLSNCEACYAYIPIDSNGVTLSFLPLSHVFERMAGYYYAIWTGATICYAERMDTVPENLVETAPTMCCSVPRFFEKMQAKILEQVSAAPPLRQKLFFWAKKVGENVSKLHREKKAIPVPLQIQHALASRLVSKKIQKKLGGRLRFFVSGGAPLPKELAEFFHAFGVLILEGYGLTETSPVISVNSPNAFKFGSVGKVIPDVEVKIAEDGEILVRGPNIMRGYFNNAAATREVIVDGWFLTGDIGRLDEEGFLFITDRKKDIIATAGGKKVSPQNIEGVLISEPLIGQVCVFGDRKPFLTALIVPNWETVKTWAAGHGMSDLSKEALARQPSVLELFRKRIDQCMVDFPPFSTIKYFSLMTTEFTQPSGELTPTLKLKRKVIAEKYAAQIEHMYSAHAR